jgi:hypothetical protein
MSGFRLTPPAEPTWHDLGMGVRVLVQPLTTAQRIAADLEVERRVAELRESSEWPDSVDARTGLRAELQAAALMRYAVIDWSGVGGDDDGPLAWSPALADAFARSKLGLVLLVVLTAADREAAAEGNASAPLPSGDSAGATTTAAAALH